MAEKSVQESKSFWRWTAEHLDDLRVHASDPDSAILERMAEKLHQYDSNLGVEISLSDNGKLEVTITAFGERDSFESVAELVKASPNMEGLKVVAFRQPEGSDFSLEVDERVFSPATILFEPMKGRLDPKSLGLMLFFPEADEIPREQRLEIAQVMLQAILGEYEGALRFDHIEVADTNGVDLSPYIPLAEVAAYIEWFEKRNPRSSQ